MKSILYTMLLLSLTSCTVFLPEQSKSQYADEDCKLHTKSLVLKSETTPLNGSACGIDCMRMLLVVPAGSFVVSGSVVLVNNTLNWLEYSGRCKLKLGAKPENNQQKNLDPIKESCILECDLTTSECRCISKTLGTK